EELVQRLLALVVPAAQARAAMAADGVDLIDEDDAGGVPLSLVEEIAHAGRAHADEHLDEVRAREREERHARLTRNRLGEECLARARRTEQERALRDASAEALEFLRIAQELDDLFQLLLRLVGASHVLERDLGARFQRDLGTALPELHRACPARLDLADHHHPE